MLRFNTILAIAITLASHIASAGPLSTIGITRSGKIITRPDANMNLANLADELLESRGTVVEPPAGNNVIGTDARVHVSNTTAFPTRTVGHLPVGCTGTLIGPRHVITAGHCVYDIKNNKWFTNLKFSPARNGQTYPYGSVEWSVAYTIQGWTYNEDKNYDIALIVLEKPIGDKVGWMGIGPSDELDGESISIAGYPSEKTWGSMWQSSCAISDTSSQRLMYPCDTTGGMSGSSMFAYSGSKRIIRGIHAYGGSSYNSGTRITPALFAKINEWIKANP